MLDTWGPWFQFPGFVRATLPSNLFHLSFFFFLFFKLLFDLARGNFAAKTKSLFGKESFAPRVTKIEKWKSQ
jgi:hypothetical protein